MPSTAILLLAAGNSSRLGRPKQLLPFGQGTLLRHAAQTALDAALGPVIVVLGSVEQECRETLHGMSLTLISNPQWAEGMGSSIAFGTQHLREEDHDGVIIMLCDQPAITPAMLRALVMRHEESGCSMVASRYGDEGDTLGPPVFFTGRHFPQMRLLSGQQGARDVVKRHRSEGLGLLLCPEARFDVDEEDDVKRLPVHQAKV